MARLEQLSQTFYQLFEMKLILLALLFSCVLAFGDAKGVFYAFTGSGYSVLDPRRMQVIKTVPYNTTIPGTGTKKMCTPSSRSKTKCSWQGAAATVGGRFVFVADSSGSRVIVIDAARQHRPIKAIKTHGFPFQVTYIKALDEVWVLCWRKNILDVVGDASGATAIQKISNASSMAIKHSIQAQTVKAYKYISHSYLRAENCQNPDPSLQYGIVSHYNEPGIHKIDLANKRYDKFINTSTHGCKSTFGLAFSSVRRYAFVQCLGQVRGNPESKMLIIDMDNERVVHNDDSLTVNATGYPYSSPDGKFVLVLNADRIIVYLLRDNRSDVVRLADVQPANFLPSKIAFARTSKGYLAYVSSKNTDSILVIRLRKPYGQLKTWFINGVGFAADLSARRIQTVARRYRKAYMNLLKKTGKSFDQAEFHAYVKAMIMAHIRRPISTGCGRRDRYVASPANNDGKVVILDGQRAKVAGAVDGVAKVRSILWVPQQ
eukprot:gene12835-14155_t